LKASVQSGSAGIHFGEYTRCALHDWRYYYKFYSKKNNCWYGKR